MNRSERTTTRWRGSWARVRLLALFLLSLFIGAARTVVHELADGFVERWCEVVVRDEAIVVRYTIGYSPATAAQCLKAIEPEEVRSSDLTPELAAEKLHEALGPHVARTLRVWLGDEIAVPQKVEVKNAYRHPMCLEVELSFAPPATPEPWTLKIEDRVFPKLVGAARQALRSKSIWQLIDCNVAPLIVRAKPLNIEADAKHEWSSEIVAEFKREEPTEH